MNIQPEEETFEVSISLGNSIIQYLGNRPYIEVVGLIQQLQLAANVSAQKKQTVATPVDATAKGEDEQPNE